MSLWDIYKAKKLGINTDSLFASAVGKRLAREYEWETEAVPYIYRESAGGADIGHLCEDTIIGGSLSWNQLVNLSGDAVTVKSGFKYLAKINNSEYIATSDGSAITINDGTKDNVFVLNRILGTTIAEYIYALENSQTGKGVAFFRNLFPEEFYPYDPGSIRSVNVSAHIMRDTRGDVIGNYALDDSLTLLGIPKLSSNKIYYDGDTYESNGTVTRKYKKVVFDGSENWQLHGAIANWFYLDNAITDSYLDAGKKDFAVSSLYLQTDYTHAANMETGFFALGSPAANVYRLVVKDARFSSAADFKANLAESPLEIVYKVATSTTETAEGFQNPQRITSGGTEEYVVTKQNGVAVPVGHSTKYQVPTE